MTTTVLLAWSGGKDCALALYYLLTNPNIKVGGLICTISSFNRVGLHGTNINLIKKQAELVNLPAYFISTGADTYKEDFLNGITSIKSNGVIFDSIAFGDIFLADLKLYREQMLQEIGITPIFPLWAISTPEVSRQIIKYGIEAIIICINHNLLAPSILGQKYAEVINDLHDVDICGENGEFHTFVVNAPFFTGRINYHIGHIKKSSFNSYLDIF